MTSSATLVAGDSFSRTLLPVATVISTPSTLILFTIDRAFPVPFRFPAVPSHLVWPTFGGWLWFTFDSFEVVLVVVDVKVGSVEVMLEKILLFADSFFLSDLCLCLFQCKRGIHLEAFGQCCVTDPDDESVANHFVF